MSGDVTIPTDVAKRRAVYLRGAAADAEAEGRQWQADELRGLADLLDAKPSTLRDEVIAAARAEWDCCGLPEHADHIVTAALAVVRRRIEALPHSHRRHAAELGGYIDSLTRDDVLALFDGVEP